MDTTRLRKLVERYGGTLEVGHEGRSITYRAGAPSGHVWAAAEVHELVSSTTRGPAEWSARARSDLAERVAYGTEPCTAADCEWCDTTPGFRLTEARERRED